MIKIDGKKIATELIHELIHEQKPEKSLAVVLVGPVLQSRSLRENKNRDRNTGFNSYKASLSFIKQKEKVAKELGIEFGLCQLDESISQEELEKKIEGLSNDEKVGGVIVQLPLPEKFNRDAVLSKIDSSKNVDNDLAVLVVKDVLDSLPDQQRFEKFKNLILRPMLCVKLRRARQAQDIKVAVVGHGFLVGQPIVRWLTNGSPFLRQTQDKLSSGTNLVRPSSPQVFPERSAAQSKGFKLKVADINTKDLKGFLADADLVITGVGKKDLIDPTWLKEGVGVIDFGFPADLKLPLALPFEGGDGGGSHLSFYTPTPGGTGPILVAELFRNFYKINSSHY